MSSPEMPEMFDRLTAQVGEWAARSPEPPQEFELSSERELTGTDPDGLVTVTMKDFKVEQISLDGYWFDQTKPSARAVEAATVEAVNDVLGRYLRDEILEAQSHALPMDEVYAGLKELSADFNVAYANALSRLPSSSGNAGGAS
ncbi:hypothetical protein ACQB6R_09555 [Propionibacteriaceae bacterium G1746]|uniref:hypothetical protein n=1 Tax=Aestuariimicrobium sp. G57 TaxID=3418485 RepID=UPI003C1B743C